MKSVVVKMKRKRSSNKQKSKYCYESPLNVFKKSWEDFTSNIVNDTAYKDERLTCGMQSKQNATDSSSKKFSSRNSVIVINDSDSEKDDGNNDNETNDEETASLSVIECSPKPISPLKQKKKKSGISTKQNTNRSCTILQNNDSSVLCLSDTQESAVDGENIAPSQTEDDVIELWSCLKNSSNANKNKKKYNPKCNLDETNAIFIDKKPNLMYLKCLRTKHAQKMKTKEDIYKTRLKAFIKPFMQRTLKCSDNNRRKNQCNNNLDSSLTKSEAHCSDELQRKTKKINGNENNKTCSKHKLREIIVDGCNVAMAHTNGKEFSEKGIQIVVDYFELRGHIVKVFLPQHVRKKKYSLIEQLYKKGTVVFTPSRFIDGRKITSYDDRFILKYATLCGGVVISSDQYRDLYREKPEWRNTILNRLLIPTFVGDYIMFPEDPLGRFGPNLERFLRH